MSAWGKLLTRILPGAVPAFLFWLGFTLPSLSIRVLLLPSSTDGPALVKSDWGSGGLSMSASFVIGVRLEFDIVLRTGAELSRTLEHEVAAVADVLFEVETIGLGSTGNSGKKKWLQHEAKAISLDGLAGCDEDGWLCAEEKSEDWMVLTDGELGVEISISDLHLCKWAIIVYLAFNK